MQKFKHNDVVHCPTLSDEPFTLYTKDNSSGVYLEHNGEEFWFSEHGLNVEGKFDWFGYSTYPKIFFSKDLPCETIKGEHHEQR